MSIQEIPGNIKRFLSDTDLFLTLVLILVAVTSFGLGRMSLGGISVESETARSSVTEEELLRKSGSVPALGETPPASQAAADNDTAQGAEYVASKNGTKYHLPWCPGASQIKEANKIWFNSKAEAEAAGYSPASNCKGI